MLIFEITQTNTPLAQKGLAPILIAPPHTYATQATISSVKQSKTHNQWCCLHWMPRHDKCPTVTAAVFYLWRIDTNFKWFSTVALSGTVYTDFSCCLSCALSALSSASWVGMPPYCWLATSLFSYSVRLSFLKHFWKNTYPTFKDTPEKSRRQETLFVFFVWKEI